MKQILVVGSANLDFVVGVDHAPEIGETILCRSFKKVPGGKGANQAYACGRLGCPTVFLGTVGDDGLGDTLLQSLQSAGVAIDAVQKAANTPTGMAIVTVNAEGNNCITVIPGANDCCDLAYLKANRALFEQSDIVLLQMEIPYESIYYAIRLAKQLGKTVVLNPAPAPDYLPEDIYADLDFLTPNESEFKRLTGCPTEEVDDMLRYSTALLDKGVKHLLITLGSRGALLIRKDGHHLFTPPKIKAVDSTAAGDTFNAAFLRKLAEGCSCEEAITFANFAGALSVSKEGAQTSIPSYEEVCAFQASGTL